MREGSAASLIILGNELAEIGGTRERGRHITELRVHLACARSSPIRQAHGLRQSKAPTLVTLSA
ncbi:Unannotated [Lentimonas sp. CC19]|nr:Unannotated [Lentimonas sp. CC19]CAA6697020.1 Unannotated [Lentimonas sp. CC10]CAA7070593.1 Unannotated [Lentimonas sp. CC11]